MIALGLLILRLVVGLTIAGHGAQKLFGWWGGPGMSGWTQMVVKLRIRPAQPWAWVAALAEFGGGILLALGLLTPLAAVAIAGSMIIHFCENSVGMSAFASFSWLLLRSRTKLKSGLNVTGASSPALGAP